jgi:hypothetical protein
MDGPHQIGFFERFGQEVDRAGLDRAYRRGNIAVSRDEHNLREGRSPAWLSRSRPLMSGRWTSRTRHAGMSGFECARYSAAERNVTACKSKVASSSASASQMRGSSSTMNTTWSCGSTHEEDAPLQGRKSIGRSSNALLGELRRHFAKPFDNTERRATALDRRTCCIVQLHDAHYWRVREIHSSSGPREESLRCM